KEKERKETTGKGLTQHQSNRVSQQAQAKSWVNLHALDPFTNKGKLALIEVGALKPLTGQVRDEKELEKALFIFVTSGWGVLPYLSSSKTNEERSISLGQLQERPMKEPTSDTEGRYGDGAARTKRNQASRNEVSDRGGATSWLGSSLIANSVARNFLTLMRKSVRLLKEVIN
nr:homeodomain-like, DEK [Tanacetum cinerariifolium]